MSTPADHGCRGASNLMDKHGFRYRWFHYGSNEQRAHRHGRRADHFCDLVVGHAGGAECECFSGDPSACLTLPILSPLVVAR